MSAGTGDELTFDPYHEWLGIPPAEQPPNHYRLLGVDVFESNADVMRDATEQRVRHVRSFQLGPRSAESQLLLNEIMSAKICLLSPIEKAAYDQQLAALAAEQNPPPVTAVPLS